MFRRLLGRDRAQAAPWSPGAPRAWTLDGALHPEFLAAQGAPALASVVAALLEHAGLAGEGGGDASCGALLAAGGCWCPPCLVPRAEGSTTLLLQLLLVLHLLLPSTLLLHRIPAF